LEKEAIAGGLCRSQEVDGAPLDIGGGHFLDMRKKEVLDFLFRFMPRSEWRFHQRVSKIMIHGHLIDHPLEANLWQLPRPLQIDYLESIAKTGSLRGEPMPTSFVDWIEWKLGQRIAQDYMLPYNKKLWSTDLNKLGTYWLYKLPNVSFRETLQSCLEGKAFGSLPAHGTFLYPESHGYGEVWRRMGEALGDQVIFNFSLQHINIESRIINNQWQADTIINTIPWPCWTSAVDIPEAIRRKIAELEHVSINVDYQPENLNSHAHWIYDPSNSVSHHRQLLRHNFCPGSRGYWIETNAKRSPDAVSYFRNHNDFAYPINTQRKPEAIKAILEWAKSKRIVGAGRWGTWEHMNSDIAVHEAMLLADKLLAENTQ
jgi:protoporphyrinogen oxidase